MSEPVEKTRIDKWLWAVRFFKTRRLASDACTGGKVKINGQSAKPSSIVKTGDEVQCKKDHINYVLKIEKIIEKRVGAPIAATCFTNITPEEELKKFENWFNGLPKVEFRDRGTGRPTKKERRDLDGFKDFYED